MTIQDNVNVDKKVDVKTALNHPDKLDAKSWKLIEKLVLAQVRQNRWSGLGKWILRLLLLTFVILMAFGVPQSHHPGFEKPNIKAPHIANIHISGVISENGTTNARSINASLDKAFEGSAEAIILSISSPGGSPVQSDLIWQKIMKLKKEHNKPVYSVIGDVGASGAYYIASASDKIIANSNSIVGSIGVINSSFGFNKLIDEIGIERRVISSGPHKGGSDPFVERSEFDTKHMSNIVSKIHDRFKKVVITGRKDKLNKDRAGEIFSGLIWVGEEALELGLIDDIQSFDDLADTIGEDLKVRNYSARQSPFDRFANRFGKVMIESLFEVNAGQPKLY